MENPGKTDFKLDRAVLVEKVVPYVFYTNTVSDFSVYVIASTNSP